MMPPPESHLALSEAEKALLRRWVAEGADYKPHWSLIPVHDACGGAGAGRRRNPDRRVRARAAAPRRAVQPAPQAAPEILLRRLALNLTGLPPTPAEIDAFLADRSPDAYARAVDR